MRNILIRFLLWAVERLNVSLVDEARLHGGNDAVERGARWEAFYREQGGLADMIVRIRQEYFEAASAVGHRDNDKLYEFAVADRLARELDREVQKIVVTGKSEAARRDQVQREEAARILRAI